MQLSEIQPQLQKANVRLIGIGLEWLGLEDFVKGNFFKGDLFIDDDQKSYRAMGYARMSTPWSLFGGLINMTSFSAGLQATLKGLGGNMWGDGFQNGGMIIVEGGGNKVIFSYKQDGPADHVPNDEILNLLSLH